MKGIDMSNSRMPAAIFVAAGLTLGGVMGAVDVTPAQAQDQSAYSDTKLQSFAQAAVKLIDIRSDFRSEMQNTQSDEEKAALQQKTNQRMAQAVKDTQGISVEEYNQIASASRSDQALAQRINKYIKETGN